MTASAGLARRVDRGRVAAVALTGWLLPASVMAASADRIDTLHESSEKLIQNLASTIDGFFVNDEFATFEDNGTRVRLRLNLDHLENAGWDLSPKVKINLQLPALSERLSLVVNDGDAGDAEDPVAGDDEENDLALRWRFGDTGATELKFDLGLRLKGGELDPFTRLNAEIDYPVAGQWLGRTSNRLYHYAQTGWRNDFRQYFDRPFGDTTLLRSRTRIEYLEENDHNPNLEQRFTLFRSLGERSAIAYEVLWRQESFEESEFASGFEDPQDRYQQVEARIRYRRRVWRPWLYVEVWPFVQWAEERNGESLLGFRARLEVNLGSSGSRQLDD